MIASSTSAVAESSSKDSITEFSGLYTVVTIVTVRKRDGEGFRLPLRWNLVS